MSVSLANWSQTPRDYQERAINAALEVGPGRSLLLASPTGTGKGTMELGLLRALRSRGKRAWISTPSLEVLRGYLERCGASPEELRGSAASLSRLGRSIYVTTPVRLRNSLKGRVKGGVRRRLKAPEVLILDEAHHATDENVSGGGLRTLCPGATVIGFTATPFRATPDDTHALLETWGRPLTILTIPQAVEIGAWALPKWRVEPLVDDDEASIVRGDIDADEATLDAVGPLADLFTRLDLSLPTCVTVSRVPVARALEAEIRARGLETRLVTGDTPTSERAEAYERCAKGGVVLLSVKVLGEGVDLPWLKRWVDASPTLSPVAFLQKLGRVTRPGGLQPEYVGTNRNLERHGYLLQGALPREEVRLAQERFGGASKRGARAGMLKCVGKAKPVELPLAGGVKGTMWALWQPDQRGGPGQERCVLLDPTSERVLSAVKDVRPSAATYEERWAAWTLEAEVPKQIEGFRASNLAGRCSANQLKWWTREAENRGLDAKVVPTKAQFFALPVLVNCETAMTTSGQPLRAPEKRAASSQGQRPAATGGERAAPEGNATEAPADGSVTPLAAPGVPDGYYTVVDGPEHRTYRVSTQPTRAAFAPGKRLLGYLRGPENETDWQDCAFLLPEGPRCWARFRDMQEKVRADFAAISGDSRGAGKLFAIRSGRCWRCARLLTTPESVHAGIGPECAAKTGAEWGERPEPPRATDPLGEIVGEILGDLF